METLWAKLMVDDTEIGDIAIRRAVPDDPDDDTICQYAWFVKLDGQPARGSNHLGPDDLVRHRHGDPPWTLLAAVLDKAGYGKVTTDG